MAAERSLSLKWGKEKKYGTVRANISLFDVGLPPSDLMLRPLVLGVGVGASLLPPQLQTWQG